jgi:hypothetical protein
MLIDALPGLRQRLTLLAAATVLPLAAACGGADAAPAASPPTPAPDPVAAAAPAPAASAPAETPAAAPVAATPPPSTEPARSPATLKGALMGKPFAPVGACIIGAPKKDVVAVEIYDAKDFDPKTSCGVLAPVPGNRKLGLLLSWKADAKTDVATLKAGKTPDGYLMEVLPTKKFSRKDLGKDIKPTGTVAVVHYADKKGDVARIHVEMNSGKDALAGDIDVDVPLDLAASWPSS